jgi:Flp pilus assembly protein TadD/ubiquinone/menaquinone biosynthesis C-methylase UbiE
MTSGGKGPWAWAALNMLYKYKMYFQYDKTLIKKYTDIIHWALGILRDELYGMLSDESHPGTIQELFSQTVDQSILRIEYLLNYYSDFKKDFYELLALLSLHKPDLHKAVESWKSAMEIEPHSQPLLLLGELLKKAMTEGSARPAASDLPNCHPAPGNDTRDVKEHACLDASRDIPATKPDDPATLHQYAISLFQQGRIGESIQKMERALELDPLNAEFHNDIGVIYHASGNSEKALSHFEKALEINPEDLDARKNLEEIRMRNRGCGQTADIGQTVQEGHKPSASPDIHVCNAELRRKSELRDMHAFGCPAVGTTQDVAVDWTQAFDYQTLTDEEIDEYSHIEVTEDLREGGIHAQKAWAYWFEYLGARFLKTSLSTEIVSFCNTIEHPRILSLGCGYGGIELNIAGLLDKPFHITAVDLNGQLFSRARQEAKSHGFDVNFMDLDLNYVFIPENSFDLIFAHASLHHLLNLEHVFHQIHRGLKDHGRLIVQDIIGKTQVLFWKENVDRAIEVVAQMPAQYKKGIPDQQAIIAPYAEPAMQKGMEGIRQEEIPTLLESFFTPVKSFRYGAFMRLICTHPELGKRLDPDRPADREYLEELFNLDLQLVAQNKLRPTEMLAVYEKSPSVDISGVQAQAHQRLGELLVRQGEAARAFEHFKRAAVIARGDNETPRDPAAERKPSASPEQEKMHAALQACHDIRAEHPGHVESRLALGQGFFSLEDPDEAGQHLRIASAQDPDNPRILHQHALLLFEQGHAEESIAHLARALEMEPRNAEMHNDIGAVYYACNEAATAQVHFEQALEIDPGDRIALKNLTELCIEQGRITHAREICARLRALDPEDEEADNMWSAIHKLRPETAPSVTPAADSANSVLKNKVQWSNYDWPEGGDEWSASWGSTGGLWQQTILPRIRRFLPARHVLEIAPGFGRCTQYLLTDCQRLSIVDLTEKCIKACRRRFKGHTHISFFVNDGRSLDMIEDNSIDFVFSWDSLVHVERDVMQAYLRGLAAKLKSGGIGFFHHSNIGAFQDPATGKLTVENLHWRGENMSAELFRTYCKDAGLRCLTQEIIAWGGDVLNDCMSVFAKDDGYEPEETVILENPHFMEEAAGLRNPPDMYEHFHPAAESGNLNGKEIQEPAENKKQGGTSLRSPCVLSIILSVKDTMKAAYRSIQSILRNIPRQGVELIVVDNGSHDGTRDYLSKLMHENVTVLLPEGENTLVQGGILGAGKASGKFLVFLDDSVVLSKSWMTCIMKTLENGSDWDAVVGKTISAKGTILEAGSTFPGKTGLESRGSGTPIPDPAYNSACRVGSGSRHCMLIKKDIWNEVKPFNPGLENLGSALIDLGLTLASRGYRILYQPRCILIANRVDPLHPAATDALSPDPETLASLRPKDLSAEVMTAVNGSESSKVLVLGIYLANNLNTVSDIVSILSSSKNHAVEQKWVALNGSPPDEKVAGVTVKTLTGRVPKFEIINGLLSGEDLSRYDYVILCDDDVVLPDHFVDTFIAMQSCYGFAVAQPARTLNSYIDHPIVEQHVGVHARQTRFVEIGPVVSFHRSAFEFIFPFDLTSSMGWGYENVWAYEILHRDLKMGIVDAVCVDHSIRKPVANYDWKHADSERSAYLEKHDHLPMEECFQVVDAHIVAEESI